MPHIATWWCGQKSAREEVLSRLDEVAIESAYGRGVPGFPGHGPVLASELSAAERERLKAAINDRGIDFVGQELVRLSTTPVWEDGRLTPRPFVLRVFAAATPQGLDHHARRLLPDRRTARCPRGLDGRRRPGGRCLGGVRQGGFDRDAAAGGRHRAHQAHRRRAAEPSRRQSVLARPLSRARRSDAAADPRAGHAAARSRQAARDRQPRCTRSSASSACW